MRKSSPTSWRRIRRSNWSGRQSCWNPSWRRCRRSRTPTDFCVWCQICTAPTAFTRQRWCANRRPDSSQARVDPATLAAGGGLTARSGQFTDNPWDSPNCRRIPELSSTLEGNPLSAMLYSGVFDLPWWGVMIVALVLTHITIASVTIFLHRCQAHRALELHPIASHFFRFWLWLTTGMVTKEWAAIHRKHHAKCETPEDP